MHMPKVNIRATPYRYWNAHAQIYVDDLDHPKPPPIAMDYGYEGRLTQERQDHMPKVNIRAYHLTLTYKIWFY